MCTNLAIKRGPHIVSYPCSIPIMATSIPITMVFVEIFPLEVPPCLSGLLPSGKLHSEVENHHV